MKADFIKTLALIIVTMLIIPQVSFGDVMNQMHFRTGMVSTSLGSAVGSQVGGVMVAPSFDFEFETFLQDRNSLILHMVLAHESASSVTRYAFAGAGKRYYLGARGSNQISTDQDVGVIVRPTFRSYLGWEVGMSENVVNVLTASLQSLTTAIDGGGYYGILYKVSNNVSLDAQLGMNFAFGFSSVAASGMIMKAMFGMTYSF